MFCYVFYYIRCKTLEYQARNNCTLNVLDIIKINVGFQVKADIIKHKSYEAQYSGSTCGLAPFTIYATTSSLQNPAHFQ